MPSRTLAPCARGDAGRLLPGVESRAVSVLWRVKLFEGPRLTGADGQERRLRSQRVGALLAFLCLRLGRDCPREEVAEALWPDEDPQVTANRLRVALTALRHLLEPPGTPPGSVVDTSRVGFLRLRPESLWCDLSAFEQALQRGELHEAARLASGPLLPGFWDEWILTERERIEARREGLPAPSPSASAEEVVLPPPPSEHQLPLYLTRFFGREAEREHLTELLESTRLVTLVGLGGMGKTRLAVETARRLALPAVFVALADLTEPERLPDVLLQALGVTPSPGSDSHETLRAILARRGALLLLLDNAEQLLAEVAALVLALLEQLPALRLLVTSRQPLAVLGETVVMVEPLEPPTASATPVRLLEFPAVALFVDRAQQVHPGFALTERHTSAVIALCQRLEGMPLAIELAAARTRTQTPTQVAAALEQSTLALETSLRGVPERHRSLRAVIQGSVEALSSEQRRFFLSLSIFQGGWTTEAAEYVLEAPQAELFLEELYQRSLITLREDENQGTMRFGFLETLRQFAAEHCEGAATLAGRHATYFLTLACRGDEHDVRTFDPLESDLENLERALGYSWEQCRDRVFWEGLRGFLTFAFVRGHQRRATLWAERAVACATEVEPPECRFELLHRALMLYNDLGRWEEIDALAERLEADARELGLLRWAVEARQHLAYTASQRFRHEEAVAHQREALALARTVDDRRTLVRALVSTNRVFNPRASQLAVSEPESAQALYREAEAASREALALELPHSRYQSNIHMGLYLAVVSQGRLQEAYTLLKKSQDYAWRLRAMALLMYSFYFEQQVERELGSFQRAALLFGAFLRLREQMGFVHPGTEEERRWRELLQERLGSTLFEQQVQLAYQLSLEALVLPRTWDELVAGKEAINSPINARL